MGETLKEESAGKRLKSLLSSLDDRDMEEQAVRGIRALIELRKDAADVKLIAKELLSGMGRWGPAARGHRLTLAAYVVEKCEEEVLFQIVRIVSKQVFRQVGEEKHVGNVHAVSVLMGVVVERIMMQKNMSLEGPPCDKSADIIQDWLFKTLFPGVLKAASRSTDKNSTAMCCSMLHGLLSALMHWTHLPGVEQLVRFTLESITKCMTPESFITSCAGAYPPIQRCIEILGVRAPSHMVCAALDVCLLGAKEKIDFQARRSAFDTITTIAASAQVQVHKGGQWELKSCPVLSSVMRKKKKLKKALENAKYDKILIVRKAASLAAVEVDNIPDVPASTSFDAASSNIISHKPAKNEAHRHPHNARSLSASAIQLPAAQDSETVRKGALGSRTVSKAPKTVECRQSRLPKHQSAGVPKESSSKSAKKPDSAREIISPAVAASRKLHSKLSHTHTKRSPSITKVDDALTTKSCSVYGDSGRENDAPTPDQLPSGVRKRKDPKVISSCQKNARHLASAAKFALNTPEQLDICKNKRTSGLPESSQSRNIGVCTVPARMRRQGLSIDCEALLDRTIVTLRECMEGLPTSFGEDDPLIEKRSKMLVPDPDTKNGMDTVIESENTGKESDRSASLLESEVADPIIKTDAGADSATSKKALPSQNGQGCPSPDFVADEVLLSDAATSQEHVHCCGEIQHSRAGKTLVCSEPSTSTLQRMEPYIEKSCPKQDVVLQRMLNRSTAEIQDFYKKQEKLHLEFLDMQMERSIVVMKSMIEHEKSIVQAATQHALNTELNMFNERFGIYAQHEKNITMCQETVAQL